MTNHWRKLVLKEADFVFEVPVGTADIWKEICMNLYSSLFACPSSNIAHGKLAAPLEFWLWVGSCVVCGKIQQGIQGLFCANFSTSQGGYPACQQSWCAEECYTLLVGDKFHVDEPRDEGGFVWHKKKMSYVIWWQAVEIICNVLSNAAFACFER
jgi:hypothetical protein